MFGRFGLWTSLAASDDACEHVAAESPAILMKSRRLMSSVPFGIGVRQ